ncbi:MAG TPA: dethiobiotin synthase [Candidatus Limnocylindrales bacterium]|nr:dethiobiotin synthase [Candidatus Limnocylindrales bacterium]
MGSGLFITGTDTGVGKTFFTCALAALLRSYNYQVGVMKPAETGCAVKDGQLFAEDAWRLKSASGCAEPNEIICPYRLAEPLAPSLAAERAGVKIDIDHLLALYRAIRARHDITLVEGAGGLMVPVVPGFTFADFARVAKLPIIVVAANRLGAINHLLLTLEHASCKGLGVVGYVFNRVTAESSLAAETNREALTGMTGVACLGELPFVSEGKADDAELLTLLDREFDLETIDLMLRKK